MEKSKLEAYFELNKVDISAQKYSYSQIPQFYVWDGQSSMWCSRKKGYQIGRLTYTHHGSGELWYLRMLLCKICGPTSFKDLLTVGGVVYPTFQAACDARGWLASDKEWDEALTECKSEKQKETARRFNQWVLDIGNGKIPSCTETGDVFDDVDIEIPEEFCIKSDNFSVEEIINSTYPELLSNYKDEVYMRGRAILSPTNEIVHEVNAVILEKLPGQVHSFLSIDSAEEIGESEEEFNASFPIEYLNALNEPGLPPHNLLLKENVVVMLMRNLNQILGLCNVISGAHKGTLHFIPRIEMSPTDSHLPFKLNRLQLPLQICYAMTINKSQGQSLDSVGLYLPRSVFSHGQLYVAISRVTSPSGLKIYIKGPNGGSTNVTKNAGFIIISHFRRFVELLCCKSGTKKEISITFIQSVPLERFSSPISKPFRSPLLRLVNRLIEFSLIS
ncbi:hypothetical protein DCAR_0520114 [Daucus carota subsp. sativus]|uniref:DNA helicase Pif1-like 2B domain-containing protein n=1 Tax=Daucus carota subsp. sativus TaxID=79200 RepID=A0AAF1AZQ6_DAUCS|nr:hypothetical protein DCAR_0520114 [Daucus carota subsp. sativus]